MNCQAARGVMRKAHTSMFAMVFINENEVNESVNHFVSCEVCKGWFSPNMCGSMTSRKDDETAVPNIHSRLHGLLNSVCHL